MWTIFKVFIEFVAVSLLLLNVLFFWPRGMGDLSFPTRDWTHTHALESEVLTTGPPRKSLTISLLLFLPFPVFDKWTSQVVLVVKNPLANAGDLRGAGLSPGSGRSPGGGHGNTLQDSCLENPMDRGAWQATVYEVAKSWTRLSMHTHTHTYTCRHLSPFLISCH